MSIPCLQHSGIAVKLYSLFRNLVGCTDMLRTRMLTQSNDLISCDQEWSSRMGIVSSFYLQNRLRTAIVFGPEWQELCQ